MACEFQIVKDRCKCPVGYLLPLLTTEAEIIYDYPVDVLNVNEEFIGTANNPSEYIFIWNLDPANQALGILFVGVGAYCFYLKKINEKVPPQYVLGGAGEIEFYIITEINEIFQTEDSLDLFIQE